MASFGEPGQDEGPDGSFQLLLRGQATLSKWAEEYFAANPEELDRANRLYVPETNRHRVQIYQKT